MSTSVLTFKSSVPVVLLVCEAWKVSVTNPAEVQSVVDSDLIVIAAADFILSLSPDLNEVIPDTVEVDKFSYARTVILPSPETIVISFITFKLSVSLTSVNLVSSIIRSSNPPI